MAEAKKFEVWLSGGAFPVKSGGRVYNKVTVIADDSDGNLSIDAIVGIAQYNLFKGKKGDTGDENKYEKINHYLKSCDSGLIFTGSKLEFDKNLFS